MNLPLYKEMMRVNLKGILNYAFGSAFYILFMIWLYPGIAGVHKQLMTLLRRCQRVWVKPLG